VQSIQKPQMVPNFLFLEVENQVILIRSIVFMTTIFLMTSGKNSGRKPRPISPNGSKTAAISCSFGTSIGSMHVLVYGEMMGYCFSSTNLNEEN